LVNSQKDKLLDSLLYYLEHLELLLLNAIFKEIDFS